MTSNRLKSYIEAKGISYYAFENSIGASRGSISKAVKEGKNIGSGILENILRVYKDIDPEWLLTGIGSMMKKENGHLNTAVLKEPSPTYQKAKDVVVITVDAHQNENIVYVPVKAQAGYLSGYTDPQFVSTLPTFYLPTLRHGSFRAFEVAGYSMLPYQGAGLYPADIVIGQYVEDVLKMRSGRVYVIISEEGVIIKRCINRLTAEGGKLICNSDNTSGDYPPIILDAMDIYEVWEFKAKISRQIPYPEDLFERLNRLEADYALLRNEVSSKSK